VSKPVNQIRDLLKKTSTAVVLSHVRPDGDAVGSVLALTLSLEEDGKTVFPVLFDGVPQRFRFLPGADRISKVMPDSFDLLIAVDCADLRRTGLPADFPRQPDINIDHHPTNSQYARINLVNPSASATAEMLFDLLPTLSLPITEDVAANLLTGLVTDTIGFRTDNVTPKLLRNAAELMELGAELHEIYFRGLEERSLIEARYLQLGLARLQFDEGILWTSLTLEDRKATGYSGKGDADLINLLSSIAEARVAIVFVEQSKDQIKVSWRSKEELDVSGVAGQFGGGGHRAAAGANIQGDLEAVQLRVLSATHDLLNKLPISEK
jgi:phosphoesterase RecJ-like protein